MRSLCILTLCEIAERREETIMDILVGYTRFVNPLEFLEISLVAAVDLD